MKRTALMTLSVLLVGCGARTTSQDTITAIQLYDRNGVHETISQKEQARLYQTTDFLSAQPYQKVVRTFVKGKEGNAKSKITTYHENGQIWQYLETVNGRACGEYMEWHPNGVKRMQTKVIEGIGDLSVKAQSSWVFDGKSVVWDDQQHLVAEIHYNKGMLEDRSIYYHPNGAMSKMIPYKKNQIDGVVQIYNASGELIGRTEYCEGKKEGISEYKGSEFVPRREEVYRKGELISGKYWDFSSRLISEIDRGCGMRPIFENGRLIEERQYIQGVAEGEVKLYSHTGALETLFHTKEGKKEGEEWCYYGAQDPSHTLQPMLHLNWHEDEIHGTVRTWYPNGQLESEKEIINNKKNGVLLSWFKDGSLMMIEEYENDRLLHGKYLRPEEETPVSRVVSGSGVATLYDGDGKFLRKIEYEEGNPKE